MIFNLEQLVTLSVSKASVAPGNKVEWLIVTTTTWYLVNLFPAEKVDTVVMLMFRAWSAPEMFWMLAVVSPFSYKVFGLVTPVEAEHWRGHLHSNVRTHSFPPCKESSSKSYKQQYLFLGLDDWLLIFECVHEYLRHWPWKYKNLFWWVSWTVFQRLRLRGGWIIGHFRYPSYGHHFEAALYSPCQKICIWFLRKSSWRNQPRFIFISNFEFNR